MTTTLEDIRVAHAATVATPIRAGIDPLVVVALTLIAESATDVVEADPGAWHGSELKARLDQLRELGVSR